MGTLLELVEDRWHSFGDWEKVSLESFGIRIRNSVNSKVPIEVTGCGRVNSHVCIEDSVHRVSRVDNSKCMTS